MITTHPIDCQHNQNGSDIDFKFEYKLKHENDFVVIVEKQLFCWYTYLENG